MGLFEITVAHNQLCNVNNSVNALRFISLICEYTLLLNRKLTHIFGIYINQWKTYQLQKKKKKKTRAIRYGFHS
jgi:hypothetical protein